ncbi:hypothetical protein BK005_01285 [bacterium CG10_37_50]|nr:MAG: hypothetical protein BK005_01285 [bacterium CG10_37_50]
MKKLLLLIIILFPLITLAQNQSGYTLLEPSVVGGATNQDLITYLKNAFNTLITVAIVVAIASIVYGGAMYILSGTPMKINDGKTIMLNALYGLILILTSWLILYTINPDLVTLRLSLSPINISSGSPTGGSGTDPANPITDPNNPPGNTVNPSGAGHQEVLSQLNPGIGVKDGVNLAGVQPMTIEGINNIKADCPNCEIVITSATEGEHSRLNPRNHHTGYKLDLRNTPSVGTYIRDPNNFTLRPEPRWISGLPTYDGVVNGSAVTILDETSRLEENGPHWDLQF